jgi:lysophospholipase L1-like esterase
LHFDLAYFLRRARAMKQMMGAFRADATYSFSESLRMAAKPIQVLTVSLLLMVLTCCSNEFQVLFVPLSESVNSTTLFMGDSITYYWPMPEHNAGIPGQTTAQMLTRFSTDVMGHGFKRVVILGGTNDVLQRLNLSVVSSNLDAMAGIAESANIEVVLCTLPPIRDHHQQTTAVNQGIVALAQSKRLLLVDYFTTMSGNPDFFKPDGVHPSAVGYEVMETTLAKVLND